MSPRAFAVALGIVAIAVGLFLGLRGHSVPGFSGDPIACGSAFSPDRSGASQADGAEGLYVAQTQNRLTDSTKYTASCDAARGSSAVPWALIAAGAVLAIGGLVVRTKPSTGAVA